MLTLFKDHKPRSRARSVEIKNGNLKKDILETATSVILLGELKWFYLFINCVEDTAALADRIIKMTNLTHIVLEIQSLTKTDSEHILVAIRQTTPLVRLSLRYFRLSSHGADLLSDLTGAFKHLVTLAVSDIDMSLLGHRVTSLVTSQHLAELVIDNSHVTRPQVTSLYAALPGICPRLLRLNLSGNDISGIEDRVAEAISKLNRLSWLAIRNCNIASQELLLILQSVSRSLRLLDICKNGLSNSSWMLESRHILHLRSLRLPWCQGTAVPEEVMQGLGVICKQNLPDLILMHDVKSFNAGKQELDTFAVEENNEIVARESVTTLTRI